MNVIYITTFIFSLIALTLHTLMCIMIKTHSFDFSFKISDYLGRKENISVTVYEIFQALYSIWIILSVVLIAVIEK